MTGNKYVIDASVAIKLFVSEPLSDKADTLFSFHDSNPSTRFYVPDLFYIEKTLYKVKWLGALDLR
jgi:predicted nucleic acid-binding protein